jgi:hypothetical protein
MSGYPSAQPRVGRSRMRLLQRVSRAHLIRLMCQGPAWHDMPGRGYRAVSGSPVGDRSLARSQAACRQVA